MKHKRPGFLQAYANARGISHVAMRKQLWRIGVNYLEAFDWAEVDALREAASYPTRDPFRKGRFGP